MNYALYLADDNRILSATYPQFAVENAVLVDALPDGDISDYRYVNGEYIYDPVPEIEEIKEPTTDDILNALLGVSE